MKFYTLGSGVRGGGIWGDAPQARRDAPAPAPRRRYENNRCPSRVDGRGIVSQVAAGVITRKQFPLPGS